MRSQLKLALLVVLLAPFAISAQRPSGLPANGPTDPPGTFSILGFDPDTGEIGAAVQSRVFSVGNGVLWAEAGVGAVATQAIVDVSYGPQGLELLRKGLAPKDIIKTIWDRDPDPGYRGQSWPKAGRQFAVINAKGEVAAFTGPQAPAEAGDAQGKFCTAQGNTLGRPDGVWPPADGMKPSLVPAAMVAGFENSEKNAAGQHQHISLRLVAALEAGQNAGGDNRGQQSAALIVVKKDAGVWLHNDVVLRLQVDDSREPIKELRRLVEMSPAGRSGRGRGGR
ncbi:MAG TPA: DUF1028 domain-containing protein [Vicinamibacterales bacterium]|nr:DUF1028 domain-containing protein [Vicinamibacterales bacterium]